MSETCFRCGRTAPDAVAVAAIERMTGPPWPVHACPLCIAQHGIVPLDDHPADSIGSVRYRSQERPLDQAATPSKPTDWSTA